MKNILALSLLCLLLCSIFNTAEASDTLKTAGGIKYVRIKSGEGVHPKPGQSVKVFYSRMSVPGKVVETNEGSKPFKFQISNREVIPGWDEVVQLMGKGEKFYCIIPSELGYGKKGVEGLIPPNATLYFLIEVVDFK